MSDITYVGVLRDGDTTYVTLTDAEITSVISSASDITKIVAVGTTGPQGLQGPQGDSSTWVVLTQAEYDAITPDPDTLYIIIN